MSLHLHGKQEFQGSIHSPHKNSTLEILIVAFQFFLNNFVTRNNPKYFHSLSFSIFIRGL